MLANLKNNVLSRYIVPPLSLLILSSSAATLAQDYPVVQMIKRNASNFAIDGSSDNANGQDVYLWGQRESNANQQWLEIDRGDGYYTYQKFNTNFCLDGGGSGADGQNVYLWTCSTNNQNQHWAKVNVGEGHYQLFKRNAPAYALDGNRRGDNGQSVYLWGADTNNQNQHWYFNYVNDTPSYTGCTEVDSLNELASVMGVSNSCIRVMPGTYTFDTNNVGTGLLFPNSTLLQFTGSNNRFVFDDVIFNFSTDIFRLFGRVDVREFQVTGNNNVFENLTIVDIGDTSPVQTALNLLMDGSNNLVDGFSITARGSVPYGYGDIFGKGSTRILGHDKHSGVLIRGDGNHLKSLDLYMRAYGHGVFVQGGDNVIIEDVYIEGELSTVDAVLAERGTGSSADGVDFLTVWGFYLDELSQNYRFSLQEDGIRAYNSGTDFFTGESVRTGSITVLDSTVKFMRSGVSIPFAGGEKYVENTTSLANESGFALGTAGTVVNSRGDASVGPLYEDVNARNSTIAELTLLDSVVSKIGDTPSLYLAGGSHNLTIKDGTTSVESGITLQVGGTRNGHRWLAGSISEPPYISTSDVTLDNQTPYRVQIYDNSSNATVISCGPVIDGGVNSTVSDGTHCN